LNAEDRLEYLATTPLVQPNFSTGLVGGGGGRGRWHDSAASHLSLQSVVVEHAITYA
jgi:hypothetical protein